MKRSHVSVFGLVVALICVSLRATAACAAEVSVAVDSDAIVNKIHPHVYGHFFEHIYHSANGGIWGEVVWNRSFEQDAEGIMGNAGWGRVGNTIVYNGEQGSSIRGGHWWRDHDFTVDVRKTAGNGGLALTIHAPHSEQIVLTLGESQANQPNKQHTLTRPPGGRGGGRGGGGGGRGRGMQDPPTPLAPAVSGSIEDMKWYSVRMRIEGRRVQAWLDGRSLFDANAPAPQRGGRRGGGGNFLQGDVPAGMIAIGTTGSAKAEFRNIVVKGLDGQVFWDRPLGVRQLNSVAEKWSVFGNAYARLVGGLGVALNDERCLALTSLVGDAVIVQQDGFALKANDPLSGSLWLKGTAPAGAKAQLVVGNQVIAETAIPAPTNEWKECPLKFTVNRHATASLRIVFSGTVDVMLDQVSLMPESSRKNGGFRPDLYQAFAGLRPTVMRWPGGCYGEEYRWKHGIGAQQDRKKNPTRWWEDFDPNSLGTDEYIQLCRRLNSEPLIVVNTGMHSPPDGTDTPEEWAPYIEEACQWIEYCNGPATSTWGKVRAANGHPDPYNVKLWEIDNELWRSRQTDPRTYAKAVPLFAEAMKKVDPTITIIGHGGNALDRDYDRAVIENAAKSIDVLSIHHYTDADKFGAEGVSGQDGRYRDVIEMIKNSANPKIKLYVSEWNAQTTDWRTGLYAGGILNTFEKYGETLTMAGPALMAREYTAHDWDNAFINFDAHTWYPGPNYVVMKLWHDNFAPNRLKSEAGSGAGGLNLIATKTEAGDRVILKAVNPGEEPLEVTAAISGSFRPAIAKMELVAPGDTQTRNSFAKPDAIAVKGAAANVRGNEVTFTLPAYSAAVVQVTNR
jgi:alpha-N-arabinofuranosidase